MSAPLAAPAAQDRGCDPDWGKVAECSARLSDPADPLTWSGIKSEYGQYGVNGEKVREHRRGAPATRASRGRPPVLPPECEREIVKCIVASQRQGFSKTKEDVERELIIPMALTLPTYPFPITASGEHMGPGRKWWRHFRHRYRGHLYVTRGPPIIRARAAAATPRAFELFYACVRGRMDVPENLVMVDETDIPIDCGWERRILSEPTQALARIPASCILVRSTSALRIAGA